MSKKLLIITNIITIVSLICFIVLAQKQSALAHTIVVDCQESEERSREMAEMAAAEVERVRNEAVALQKQLDNCK
ncbi:MAG: hypothetical protein JXQ90_15620 [Cyclobacteriaceae bacterium]